MLTIPAGADFILRRLMENGFDAYVVGGCVRDSLLGLFPHDWDICTSARPEQMQAVFADCRVIETGLKHGTLTVLHDRIPYEVTTFRVDGGYTDHRHPDSVSFVSNVVDDLARRDFTVNAMAWNPQTGLVDAFHGQEDLRAGIIRAVGDPKTRFTEDALRILRAVRFSAQLAFPIEKNTAQAVRELAPTLKNISAERIQVELVKLLMSDHPDLIQDAYELGITDYITRPFDSVIVKKRVQNTLGLYMNQKHLINVVYDQVYEKEENNNIMIRIMSNILGSRNSESREHILHIKTATEMMLRQLVKVTDAYPLTEADIALITTASSLHDIGKIGIQDDILKKKGKLTKEEYEVIKTHVEKSVEMIRFLPHMNYVIPAVLSHHERYDGKGYPNGIKGKEIPILGRILAVCDSFDAMVSRRAYKEKLSVEYAIGELENGKGTQFDPDVAQAFIELVEEDPSFIKR